MSKAQRSFLQSLEYFVKMEAFAGLLLVFITVLALVIANSPYHHVYELLINAQLYIGINEFKLSKPILLWINDGLMAIYFLLIGLELKREVLEGELSNPKQIILPAVAAIGGVMVPALIYYLFNRERGVAITGWAIPTATDIAFALGVLALLGDRVPKSLKIFLMTIAIFDDFIAILIIALFYTSSLSTLSLLLAAIAIILLIICNRMHVKLVSVYVFIGLLLWFCVLKSGVHATLAGVILSMTIPNRIPKSNFSPLKHLEHNLSIWVTFFILPIFAFANAGVNFSDLSVNDLLHPIPVGIALGLFLGKQIGIFTTTFIFIKCKWASLPQGANWRQIYGLSVLCGLGFTMSLFISSLAFEQYGDEFVSLSRYGILVGSLVSALVGYSILRK